MINMAKKHRVLLFIDCVVNLLLGMLLLLFPMGIVDFFGLPHTDTNFYPSLLGAVIFGIGVALGMELAGYEKGIRGLGLGGAIAINIVGSLVLVAWLLFGSLEMPLRGSIVLWVVGALVFVIGIAEIALKSWTYK